MSAALRIEFARGPAVLIIKRDEYHVGSEISACIAVPGARETWVTAIGEPELYGGRLVQILRVGRAHFELRTEEVEQVRQLVAAVQP